MTKREIADRISTEIGVTHTVAKQAVQRTLDLITEVLVNDGRIEFRNFGVFEITRRKARRARNPRTGEQVMVPERLSVKFTPGKEMEEQVAGRPVAASQMQESDPAVLCR